MSMTKKDKNGIEIKRENCEHQTPCNGCGLFERDCKIESSKCQFIPSAKAYETRIAELQAREFTRAEIEYIGAILRVGDVGCKDEYEAYKKPILAKCYAILKGDE